MKSKYFIVLVCLLILATSILFIPKAKSFTNSLVPGGIAYVNYYWPSVQKSEKQTGYYNFDLDLTIEEEPKEKSYYFWAHYFKFVNNTNGGYLGLQTIGDKKIAIFSIWGAKGATAGPGGSASTFSGEGEGWHCLLPFNWKEGKTYTLRVWELCCADKEKEDESWVGIVIDKETKQEYTIGTIIVPGSYEWLDSWTSAFVEYFTEVDDCNSMPNFQSTFTNPIADGSDHESTKSSTSLGEKCANIDISPISNGYRIKKTEPQIIKAPTLIKPLNEENVKNPVTFSWSEIEGATKYGINIKRLSDNQIVLDKEDIIETTYTLDFNLDPGDYQWNARAGNESGWSSFSTICKFTVIKKEIVSDPESKVIIELWIGNRIALVDGKAITMDTEPLILNGRTVVPLRFIAEAFKADVFFDSENQEINIAFGATYISLWINKTKARIETTGNGEKKNRIVTLDAPPVIRSGRTLVPVRFIAEAFGATIDWDSQEEKITITLKK